MCNFREQAQVQAGVSVSVRESPGLLEWHVDSFFSPPIVFLSCSPFCSLAPSPRVLLVLPIPIQGLVYGFPSS